MYTYIHTYILDPANYTGVTVATQALFCQTSLHQYFELMDGFPATMFSWTKDGNPLTTSSMVQLTATNISISSLNVNDNSTYIVTSTNAAGNTTATLTLTIYCKLNNLKFFFLTLHIGGPNLRVGDNTSNPTTIDEGGTFTVDCTVT